MKKSNNNSVTSNFAFNLTIQIITYLFPIILSPYLSRVLGSDGIGTNSYVISIVSVFSLIVNYGFLGYGTKRISECREDKIKVNNTFWSVFFAKLILFLCSIIVYLLLTFVLWNNSSYFSLFIIYSSLLLANLLDLTFLFQGIENFKAVSLLNVIFRLASLCLIFVFVKSSSDLGKYACIYSFQLIGVALFSWIFALKYISKPGFKDIHVLISIKEALFYFLPTISVTISSLIDKTMLGSIISTTEVGYYEEASKIVTLVVGLICSLAPVLLTRISYLYSKNSTKEILLKINQMFSAFFDMSLPAICGLYIIGRNFMPAYFGEEFSASVPILFVLLPTIFTTSFTNLLCNCYFAPKGKIKTMTVFYCISSVLNIVLNSFLIIFLKGVGAAIGTLSSDALMAIFTFIGSRKDIDYKSVFHEIIKPFGSSLIMTVVLLILDFLVFPLFSLNRILIVILEIIIGAFIYFVCLLVFKEQTLYLLLGKIFKRKAK